MSGPNTKELQSDLQVGDRNYRIRSLARAREAGLSRLDRLPVSLKILLENLLRHLDTPHVTWEDLQALDAWAEKGQADREIAYHPVRVVMQDFTGVPAIVDLAAMRQAMQELGGDPQKINPLSPVDLVIDHSLQVEHFGHVQAFEKNVDVEYARNHERYRFLKWGQKAFANFRVVPPGTGIVHQVNLEYLAKVVWTAEAEDGHPWAFPDSCVGTDSHTTMVNGLAVLGWGVGGIEAEAAMLGQPVSMLIPQVVGFKLTGALREGITATDLVLTVVQLLRRHGVVGKFVEFFGEGVHQLSLADRATLANMAPEYGATCGFFPTDQKSIDYLRLSGRSEEHIALVEAYAREQGLWYDASAPDPVFSSVVELDMGTVEACLSGPKRPQDKIPLKNAARAFAEVASENFQLPDAGLAKTYPVEGEDFEMQHGHIVVAAITSCTNTSNPSALLAAGLVAQKAHQRGMKTRPWVKTSLAPGSQVVTDYLKECGLQEALDALGFHLVGYGCTTCIGNTGPLPPAISQCIRQNDLVAAAVLSGNRNFEGRISPDVKANYLASPPLVVAYALAGTMQIDLHREALGRDKSGREVFLKDLWPTNAEINALLERHISSDMYRRRYANVFEGDHRWRGIDTPGGDLYQWDTESTYVRRPSFFENLASGVATTFAVENASILAILGDSVTTDHISPAGAIAPGSPAAEYLESRGIKPHDWNSYGSRRGNHEVMVRGTFANIRIRNEMLPGVEGGRTRHLPSGREMPIFEAAMQYQKEGTPLVVIAGREYGTGSSRDWAAKGTYLQGVRAVIAESFERIHRSNLIGMGVLPLQFQQGDSRHSLKLDGSEVLSLRASGKMAAGQAIEMHIRRKSGEKKKVPLLSRLDTVGEVDYFLHGGILQYTLRELHKKGG